MTFKLQSIRKIVENLRVICDKLKTSLH